MHRGLAALEQVQTTKAPRAAIPQQAVATELPRMRVDELTGHP